MNGYRAQNSNIICYNQFWLKIIELIIFNNWLQIYDQFTYKLINASIFLITHNETSLVNNM